MDASKEQSVAVMKALPGAGYISAAVIYLTMGLLAGFVAIGWGGQAPDLRGTLRALKDQPFGPAALICIALGSLGFLVWRFLQGFADLEHKGTTLIGLCQRTRYVLSGAFYGGMPVLVWRMFSGDPVRSGDHWAREIASRLMTVPFGWTLLVATGLGLFTYGLVCFYRMVRGNFHRWFNCEAMTDGQRTLLFTFGRLGYAARGLIASSIGYFVILAGWNLNPRQIVGQAGTLHRLLHQPFGPYLLGLISIGFISLGLFSLGTFRFGKLPLQRMGRFIEGLQARLSA